MIESYKSLSHINHGFLSNGESLKQSKLVVYMKNTCIKYVKYWHLYEKYMKNILIAICKAKRHVEMPMENVILNFYWCE